MHPPTKDHTDIDVENVLLDASDRPGNKDTARQEFKNEADINYMLSRFGVAPARGTPTYGEWDDTLDLQTAITSVREAREGYDRLPEELRKKFTSMEELIRAVDNESLVIKHEPAPEPVKTPQEVLDERLTALEQRQHQLNADLVSRQ